VRTCKTCKQEKPLELFAKGSGYKGGFRPHCLSCRREYENSNFHKHKHKRPYDYEKDKDIKLKRTYGITYSEYLEILESQDNRCAICGTDNTNTRALAVDHCHDTGIIRGLLCSNCNTGIGNLRDDINLLQKAIQYLENSKGKQNGK
jgi:hypothetical protein